MFKTSMILIVPLMLFQSIWGQSNKTKHKYLSDTDPSYLLLERIQKNAYGDKSDIRHVSPPNPKALSMRAEITAEMNFYLTDSIKTYSEELELSRENFNDFWNKANERMAKELDTLTLPTRYENAQWYSVISKLNHRLMAVINKEYPNFNSRILFGTIPTTSVNASTIMVPGSTDRIVLFNEDLFDATYSLTKVLIQTLDWKETSLSYKKEKVHKKVKDPEVNKRFLEIMLWYLKMSSNSSLGSYFLEPGQMKMAIVLTRSMELFALAHEYAHIILGHSPRNDKEFAYNWLQEFDADDLGFQLMFMTIMDSGVKEEKAFGRWGALLMLGIMDIFERATITATTGKIPPAPGLDTLENNMVKGAFDCLKSPKGDDCRNFLDTQSVDSHPPLWLRELLMRNLMHKEASLSQIMNDEWDFGQALIVAGQALLLENSSLLKY